MCGEILFTRSFGVVAVATVRKKELLLPEVSFNSADDREPNVKSPILCGTTPMPVGLLTPQVAA